MALATICIEQSALGSKLTELNAAGILMSIYVDDIVISSNNKAALTAALEEIQNAVVRSNFKTNSANCIVPSEEIQVFNCIIAKGKMRFTEDRMDKFSDDYAKGNAFRKAASAGYMQVVNEDQFDEMLASFT